MFVDHRTCRTFCAVVLGVFVAAFAVAQNGSVDFLGKQGLETGRKLTELTRSGHYLVLGANGELISLKGDAKAFSVPFVLVPFDVEKNKITLWCSALLPLAHVDESGDISLNETSRVITIGISPNRPVRKLPFSISRELLPDFPTRWPYRDDAGNLAAPPSGSVMSRTVELNVPAARLPEGCHQWLILGAMDTLIAPTDEMKPIPNALWLTTEKDGTFSLVHSGPRYTGVYATIGLDGKMAYGKERQALPDPNPFARQIQAILHLTPGELKKTGNHAWWQAFTDRGRDKIAPLPSGCIVLPYMSGTDNRTMIVRDGKLLETLTPPPKIH